MMLRYSKEVKNNKTGYRGYRSCMVSGSVLVFVLFVLMVIAIGVIYL